MILTCDSCGKKFVVPDTAITASGRMVQCGSCGNKWKQFPIKETQKTQQISSSKKIVSKQKPVKQKIITANALNIKPIVCVGESLKERQIRNYKLIIINQLKKCIPDNITEVIVAYEPIWSIGTGIIPKHNEIKEISNLIFNFFSKKKIKVNILYGGSVNVNVTVAF